MNVELGKIPPQAIDIEERLIGSCLIDNDARYYSVGKINPSYFYKEAHEKIFESIVRVTANNDPCDVMTVSRDMKKNDTLELCGGMPYLTSLTLKSSGGSTVEYDCAIVSQKYIARELIRISSETMQMAFDDSNDVQTIIEKLDLSLIKISEGVYTKEPLHIAQTIPETINLIEKAYKSDSPFTGCASGSTSLDRITGGWQKSDLIIVAARPSMGKTALALKFAKECAIVSEPVALFSCEMSINQLNNRFISSETDISPTALRQGKFQESDWIRIESGIGRLVDMPVYIDDTSNISITELRSKASKLKRKHGIGLLIVDYLQLMKGDQSQNREREISSIAMGLKGIAKDLDIPVIALSQLNRVVESRANKKPMLSDLRESGAIEQDADLVIFINRPAYYGISEYEDHSTEGLVVLDIAKHRNGMTGEVYLSHNKSLTRFVDLDENIEAPF